MNRGKLIVALFLSVAMTGIAAGSITSENVYIYAMDQRIDGSGFFSSYKDVTAGNLNLANMAHGSGGYSEDTLLDARNQATYDEVTREPETTTSSNLSYNKSVDYAYGPRSFYFGKSFSSGAFDSLGKEETCVKNYGSNISINSLFDSLDTFSQDVSLSLYWNEKIVDGLPSDYSKELTGKARFDLDAAFTGRGHIGVLELYRSPHDVKKLIDEDYIGTYAISKKISHDFSYKYKLDTEGWLPCCFGGWGDMTYPDRLYYASSARGVFDCTCFKPPESIVR